MDYWQTFRLYSIIPGYSFWWCQVRVVYTFFLERVKKGRGGLGVQRNYMLFQGIFSLEYLFLYREAQTPSPPKHHNVSSPPWRPIMWLYLSWALASPFKSELTSFIRLAFLTNMINTINWLVSNTFVYKTQCHFLALILKHNSELLKGYKNNMKFV